ALGLHNADHPEALATDADKPPQRLLALKQFLPDGMAQHHKSRGGATAAVGQKAALRQRETPGAREVGRGAMYFGAAAALAIADAAAALQAGNHVFRMGQARQAVAVGHGQQLY